MTDTGTRSQSRSQLRPPLRLLSAVHYAHKVWLPLVSDGRVFSQAPDGLIALEEDSGKVIWTNAALQSPVLSFGGSLLARQVTSDLKLAWVDVVEPGTGHVERRLFEAPWPSKELALSGLDLVAAGDQLVSLGYQGEQDLQWSVCGVEFTTGRVVWRWPTTLPSTRLSSDPEGVYFGLKDGSVVALDARSGGVRWRHSVGDFIWNDLGRQRTAYAYEGMVWGSRLILDLMGGWIIALSIADGRRAWAHRREGDISAKCVYRGRCYVLSLPGDLAIVDPTDGRILSEIDLNGKVPRPKVPIRRVTRPLLVSETHIFTGSDEGRILAFERSEGKYAWSYQPKGGATSNHDGSRFVVAGRRLYYSDMSYRLYCLEQDEAAAQTKDGPQEGRKRASH